MSKRSLRDYIHAAFFARDKASLAQIVHDAEEDKDKDDDEKEEKTHAEPDGDEGTHSSNVHVHIEHKGNGEGEPVNDTQEERLKACEDRIASMDQKLDKVLDHIAKSHDNDPPWAKKDDDKDESNDTGTTLPPNESGEEGDLVMHDPPSVEAELMEADPTPVGEKMRMGDAALKARKMQGIHNLLKDTVARAELLSPGIKVPTWDSAPDGANLGKQLCALRRSALTSAMETDAGKALLGNYTQTIKTMSCDAVRFVFRDASEKMRALNNARNKPSPMFGDQAAGVRGYRTAEQARIADINKANSEFWSSRMVRGRH